MLQMLRKERIGKREVVYVGEALSDLQAARNAGLDFIGVTQGMVDEPAFREAGARVIYQDLRGVAQHVLGS
jgi:phosphoglycolate phosphatase-like HAD superfamily hydrolase